MKMLDPKIIVVPEERQRRDKGSIRELTESIRKFGQLQPIVLRNTDKGPVLVAGERRLLACKELGIPVSCVFLDDLDPIEASIIELRENIDRKDLTPVERAKAIRSLHDALCKRHSDRAKPWTMAETASQIGLSVASVCDAINIANDADELREAGLEPEKMNQTALRRAARRTSKVKRLLERAISSTGDDRYSIIHADVMTRPPDIPWGTFDLVLTDPPWGIDYRTMTPSEVIGNTFKTHYEDRSVPDAISYFKLFASLLCPTGIAISFCASTEFGTWVAAATAAGFAHVYTAPLIWVTNQGGQVNLTLYPRTTSCVAVLAHLGPGSRLVTEGRTNWFFCDAVPTESRIHPAEKPVALYTWLLELACPIGGRMIDPFMGSGNSVIAAIKYGCSFSMGVDINENAVKLAKARIEEVINGDST